MVVYLAGWQLSMEEELWQRASFAKGESYGRGLGHWIDVAHVLLLLPFSLWSSSLPVRGTHLPSSTLKETRQRNVIDKSSILLIKLMPMQILNVMLSNKVSTG